MEYYNTYTDAYIKALKQTRRLYRVKLEILDHWERVVDEITRDLSNDTKGSINVNYQQGVRRSCSLTMSDVDKKYIPSENSWFWYNRKFKLYLGIIDTYNNDTYWWSQGVFITQNVSSERNSIVVNGVDKFGLFDGTLKTAMSDLKRIIPSGTSFRDLIRDTIMLDIGNGKPIDPIEPHIDMGYNMKKIQSEITIESGSHIGEIFTELASSYSADVYYDVEGRLNFHNLYTNYRISGYRFLAHQWEYDTHKAYYCNPNMEFKFDCENCVTVYTNTSNLENVSATVYNRNPQSPLRVDYLGIRMLESQEINYVNCSQNEMEERCKEYGEYLLLQKTLMGTAISFNSPIIPHMDVNATIGITDDYYGAENQTFVVQSLTIPLGAGEMSVSACNIQWLPDDADLGKVTLV